MAERFRDPVKAAQYLSHALQHDFPDAQIEVARMGGRRLRTRSCHTRDTEHVLVDLCRTFRIVDVNYHPKNAYGFVAELQEAIDGTNGGAPRPALSRVCVLLNSVKGRPIAVGSRVTPRATYIDLD